MSCVPSQLKHTVCSMQSAFQTISYFFLKTCLLKDWDLLKPIIFTVSVGTSISETGTFFFYFYAW